MSGRSIFPLEEGAAPRPGFVAFGNYQVRLQEFNDLGLGRTPRAAPGGKAAEHRATLATRLGQLNLEEFEGTSACDVNNWLRTVATRFRLLDIPQTYWLASASAKLRLNASTWFNSWSAANETATWETFRAAIIERFTPEDAELHLALEIRRLRHTGTADEYIEAHSKLRQRAPISFNHDHGAFRAQFLHAIKPHVYRWMNLSLCNTLEGCYREMRLAEDKSNSMHNARTEENNRGRQGTKREGQTGSEDRDKRNRRGQRQGSKDNNSKDTGRTSHLRNMETSTEAGKE